MTDPVRETFLRETWDEARALACERGAVRIEPHPQGAPPPAAYLVGFPDIEHFWRTPQGEIHRKRGVVSASLTFPDDYLYGVDDTLGYRVVRVHTAFFHPNHRGGIVCLGGRFRPGTRLRALIEQVHGVLTSRIVATHDALDREAASYYLAHPEEVRALESPPLWRAPVAASVRVETHAGRREDVR